MDYAERGDLIDEQDRELKEGQEERGRREGHADHAGHRMRMIQRFLQTGLDSFAEHEVLELLLFFSIPRRDTNLLAHRLIQRFGSLAGVLSASSEELALVEGIGIHSAVLLTLIFQICRKVRLLDAGVILNSHEKITDYLLPLFDGAREEMAYLLCLDRKSKLAACPCVRDGSVSGADLDVRKLVRAAVLNSAASVVLSHNHPSGMALPSQADYEATDRVRAGLDAVGIPLLDHIIVADGDYVSLRESGYL